MRFRAGGIIGLLCWLLPLSLWAVEVELWPETYFQLQQHRDVERLKIDKTRFTQYVTLNLYESSDEPKHAFYSSTRIDMDFGRDHSIDDSDRPLTYEHFAVLYAYYEWRRAFRLVDVKVGRQIQSDEQGLVSFDGFHLRFHRDFYVGVELYGGLEVNGAFNANDDQYTWPNSDTLSPDGIESKRELVGLLGAALFLDNIQNTNLRVGYRHRYSGETDSQDVSLSFRQHILGHWDVYTVDTFSLLFETFSLIRVGTSLDFNWIMAEVEYEFLHPLFDGDSIFNFFQANPEKQLAARLYFQPDRKTHVNVSYALIGQGDQNYFFTDPVHDGNSSHLVDLSFTRQLTPKAELRAGYELRRGWGGDTQRLRVGAGSYVWQRRIRLEGDLVGTFYNRLLYNDILVKNRNKGFSWGFMALSEFRIHSEISVTLKGDVTSNLYLERQFAAFLLLDVHTWY